MAGNRYRRALVPLSIGLMSASGLVLLFASDTTWAAFLVTGSAAVLAFATRLNPLWCWLDAGGLIGFAGVLWRKSLASLTRSRWAVSER